MRKFEIELLDYEDLNEGLKEYARKEYRFQNDTLEGFEEYIKYTLFDIKGDVIDLDYIYHKEITDNFF